MDLVIHRVPFMAMRKHPPLSRFGTASDDGRKVRNIRQSETWNNYTIGTVLTIVSCPK
jgi:hypothetical protein